MGAMVKSGSVFKVIILTVLSIYHTYYTFVSCCQQYIDRTITNFLIIYYQLIVQRKWMWNLQKKSNGGRVTKYIQTQNIVGLRMILINYREWKWNMKFKRLNIMSQLALKMNTSRFHRKAAVEKLEAICSMSVSPSSHTFQSELSSAYRNTSNSEKFIL